MRDRGISIGAGAVRRSWAALHLHWRAIAALAVAASRPRPAHKHPPIHHLLAGRSAPIGKLALGAAVAASLVVIGAAGLWWRLASGPLSIDMVTPWLISAIEDRFGGRHHVQVGGTQIERSEEGHTALRLRDIVVRDRDGAVVAVAPKAELGISGVALLAGSIRPQRLSLIGAGLAVRIETDGQVSVMPGADQPPAAMVPRATTLPGSVVGSALPLAPATDAPPGQTAQGRFAALLGWLDRLDALGLDGLGLIEIGLKSGTIVVDDRRSGKQWAFDNINLSLTRPVAGGVALAITSTGADGPWSLVTTVTPRAGGQRLIEAIARDVSPKDLLLALRVGDNQLDANTPISATVRAELAPDATPLWLEGQIVAGAGHVGVTGDADTRMLIDEAQMSVRWDAERGLLLLPIEIAAGVNHFSLLGQIEPPRERGRPWGMAITGGRIEIGSADPRREPAVVLNRVDVRGRIDPAAHRLEVEQGELGGIGAAGTFSGALDFSGTEARMIASLSAAPMTASAMRRLWPMLVQPKLRAWIGEHILAASVERLAISVNAPVNTLRPGGPPLPDDGLSIEIVASGTVLQPFGALPAIRDADLNARVIGRTATVKVGRGTGVLAPSGRKLVFTNGVFEVPDTQPEMPMSRTRVRVEGSIDAVAELASLGPLRQAATVQLDPASSRGTFTAQVALSMPLNNELPKGSVAYSVEADVSNLSVERLVRGQKLEAAAARVSANAQGVQIKGDVRIGGTPVSIDYRKPVGDGDAEIRLTGTLDDAARARFGDLGAMVGGAVPVKLNGRIGSGDHESRFAVDADLLQAKITELLPGWNKLPGKPTRATFTFVDKGRAFRVEDLVIEGSGTVVKGTLDFDGEGEVVLASFPTFIVSDGDKASLRAERAPDGTLKVTMRGDVYDGRNFVKGAMSGTAGEKANEKTKSSSRDLDLDIKVGALAGFNGEALRNVELRMSRRAGHIRTFMLHSKIGRDSALNGDLRAYSNGRQVVFFQTNDAGALFRFTDTYPRVTGGRMWIAMDPPSTEQTPLDGHLELTDFTVRGEPALERVAGGAPAEPGGRAPAGGAGVKFDSMDVKFTRGPGKLVIREGLVRGSAIGATIEGQIDYTRDDVRMHGTFLPAYELNTLFSRPPILGFFLGGGQNQGLIGITYEVVGSPHAPTLRVNPMSIAAPGFLRKPFEFRGADDTVGPTGSAR